MRKANNTLAMIVEKNKKKIHRAHSWLLINCLIKKTLGFAANIYIVQMCNILQLLH